MVRKILTGVLWLAIATLVVVWLLLVVGDWRAAANSAFAFGIVVAFFYTLIRLLSRPRLATETAHPTEEGREQGRVVQPATIEMPLMPAMAAAITASVARARRITGIGTITIVVGFLLMGAVGTATVEADKKVLILSTFGGIGLLNGIILAGAMLWALRGPQKDLQEQHYLQTTGPLRKESTFLFVNLLELADRSFLVYDQMAEKLPSLPWAVVDYTKHSHFIFEVRDATGQCVYRHPEYRPTA